MDEQFRGAIYRDGEAVMLLNPEQGMAVELNDPAGEYAELPEEMMDVVDVEVSMVNPTRMKIKSLMKVSWMKPPNGLSEAQIVEWPTKAAEAVDYVMSDPDRTARFVEMLATGDFNVP